MDDVTRKIIQASVIETIKKKHQVSNTDIANSIKVHRSHIQKVAKCIRPLSEEKFKHLCKIWNVNITESIKRMELDEVHFSRWKTISSLLESRKLNVFDLHLQTGIKYLDLSLIAQGKKDLSDEDAIKIAKVLDVDSRVITDEQIVIGFSIIRKVLESLHVEQFAIDSVLKYVEAQI